MPVQAPTRTAADGEPVWDLARLFPAQGCWSVEDYLAFDRNWLVEYSEGRLEVLPMPTTEHQTMVGYLYRIVLAFVKPRKAGRVLFAPLKVRLWEGKFSEPDVVFMLAENAHRIGSRFWDGADLVMEIVSEDDPDRDTQVKRDEYARARIEEYWIIDPRDESVTVLTLSPAGGAYDQAGRYSRGQKAASVLFEGLEIDVDELFDQAA